MFIAYWEQHDQRARKKKKKIDKPVKQPNIRFLAKVIFN